MKLRSLALNQFKKFTRPIRLDGIGDGLNVVVGPNEMGKSTLLDALRAVLFEKHSSRAQPITALQNDRNQAGPVVESAFELDDDGTRRPPIGDRRIVLYAWSFQSVGARRRDRALPRHHSSG